MGSEQGGLRHFVTSSNKDGPEEVWWKKLGHCMGEVRSSSEGEQLDALQPRDDEVVCESL